MFQNLKITADMNNGTVVTDLLRLDCIISAAKAMEIMKDDYYIGRKTAGPAETIIRTLSPIMEFNGKIFHASCGFGNTDAEFGTFYKKGYDNFNDDIILFSGKGKQIIDTGRGRYKNYIKTLQVKAWPRIEFYARGDGNEIERLLKTHITHLGKKASQGYGEVAKWTVEEIIPDYSLMKDGKAMRPIPLDGFNRDIFVGDHYIEEHALIPPAWRHDNRDICIMSAID